MSMTDETTEAEEIACAWSDYRKDYGVSAVDMVRMREHKAFKAGWEAARADGATDSVLR